MKRRILIVTLLACSVASCSPNKPNKAVNEELLAEIEAEPFWTVPVPSSVTTGDLYTEGGSLSTSFPSPNTVFRTWTGSLAGLSTVRSQVESSMRSSSWVLVASDCFPGEEIRTFTKVFNTPRPFEAEATVGIGKNSTGSAITFTVIVSTPALVASGRTDPRPPPTSIADHDCAP